MNDGAFTLLLAGLLAIGVGVAVAVARRQAPDYVPASDADEWDGAGQGDLVPTWPEPDQNTSLLDDVIVTLTPSTYTPAAVTADVAAANEKAFLDMIAWSEGTAGADGYRTLFGGGTFSSFADHPRQYFPFTDQAGRALTTSAAGRYQFLARTWDGLRAKLGLPDFSPASQDLGALELIRERGALNDVRAGRVRQAIAKVAKVWASLPGAGYSQPERQLSALLAVYGDHGGFMEA